MTLLDQINFGAIHDIANTRGGSPTDAANASVAEYMRQRTRILLGLSAIGTGLQNIERGKTEDGLACAKHGYEFLRREIGE